MFEGSFLSARLPAGVVSRTGWSNSRAGLLGCGQQVLGNTGPAAVRWGVLMVERQHASGGEESSLKEGAGTQGQAQCKQP